MLLFRLEGERVYVFWSQGAGREWLAGGDAPPLGLPLPLGLCAARS